MKNESGPLNEVMEDVPTFRNSIEEKTENPDEGFFYENEEDQDMGILTKVHSNGSIVKKTTLPRSGKVAVVRELNAKETKDIQRFMAGDKDKYLLSAITVATTIDGKKETYEFYEDLKMKDSNRLTSMFQDLNF